MDWCTAHGVAIWYIQPGKPDQNTYIERFNRTYRTEVLNAHLVDSVAELRALNDTWLEIYNRERPHDSLGWVPPLTFLQRPSCAVCVAAAPCAGNGRLPNLASTKRAGGVNGKTGSERAGFEVDERYFAK